MPTATHLISNFIITEYSCNVYCTKHGFHQHGPQNHDLRIPLLPHRYRRCYVLHSRPPSAYLDGPYFPVLPPPTSKILISSSTLVSSPLHLSQTNQTPHPQARLEPNHPEKYQKFLNILNGYFQNPRSIEEVHGEVKVLLEGEEDLIRAFEKFLPAEAVKGGVGKVVESGK
jgi:hypothetical protein